LGGLLTERTPMSKRAALVALFILTLSIIVPGQHNKTSADGARANSKAEAILNNPETEKALARLGDLSLPTIRERLAKMRPDAYMPGPFLINKIIEAQHLPVATSERVERLKTALRPALAYHQRDRMPVVVLWSEHPRATLRERAVIVVTTKMMAITSDEEIRGIVAHELAHEYIWDEQKQAREANDESALREYELFCDAVAVVTLKEIGDDPTSYAKAIERMTYIGITAGSATRSETRTHPSLDTRLKLIRLLCQRFD